MNNAFCLKIAETAAIARQKGRFAMTSNIIYLEIQPSVVPNKVVFRLEHSGNDVDEQQAFEDNFFQDLERYAAQWGSELEKIDNNQSNCSGARFRVLAMVLLSAFCSALRWEEFGRLVLKGVIHSYVTMSFMADEERQFQRGKLLKEESEIRQQLIGN